MMAAFPVFLIFLASCSPILGTPVNIQETVNRESRDGERFIPSRAIWDYEFNGTKIEYTVFTRPPLPLDDAKLACEDQGTRLVSVDTKGKLEFLQGRLKEFVNRISVRSNRAAFWTCGTDLYISGKRGKGQYWFYSGLKLDTSFWNPNEPNDYEFGPHVVPETCVDLKVPVCNPEGDFKLNDEICTEELSYICERQKA